MSTESSVAPAVTSAAAFVNRFLDRLDRVVAFTAVILLASITLTVLAGVISRYVFNNSFSWTEELGSWLFIWLIFVGISAGHRQGRHIAIDIVARSIAPRWRPLHGFAIDFVVAFATIMLLFSSAKLAQTIGGISYTLQWPNFIRYLMIPVSCGVSLIYLALARMDEGRPGLVRGLAAIALAAAVYAVTTLPGVTPLAGTSPSLIMVIAFAITFAIGVPVPFALLFAVFVATWGADLLPPPAVVHDLVYGASRFILLAIPFFLTAGYLMNIGGLSARLLNFAGALVGHFRGGLAQVNVINSVLIGGISGSSAADTAGTTKILVPEMVKRGYSAEFSCAITATSAMLPNLIPPSIAMLIYALIANTSVAKLFVAGVLPALVIAALLMTAVRIVAGRRDYPRSEKATLAHKVSTFAALPALMLGIVIVGGIRFGIVTATEAGVVAVLWAFILGKFVYRSYGWRAFYRGMTESAIDASLIGLLIGVAGPFSWVLIAERVPQHFIEWATGLTENPILLLLLVNAVLLVAGAVLDITASMLIAVPLFLPLALALGVDPVHFGIIVIANLLIGGVTSPFGILVFISSAIARVPASAVFRESIPFLIAAFIGLMVITFVPGLSLVLWRFIGF